MKKVIIALLALAMLPAAAFAQEEKKQYTPEAGDFAIGFDAAPVLNYVGNMFNANTYNGFRALSGTPSFAVGPTASIMGKYMLTDELALRANIGILVGSDKERGYVADQEAQLLNPFSEAKLVDTKTTRNNGASILFGVEYRKGKKRVQGVFGGGLLVAVYNKSIKYTYGNAMTTVNQRPAVSDALTGTYEGVNRMLNVRSDGNVVAGISGNAGVEWFVAPKIALGAEVNLSLYYKFGSQQYKESERYNTSSAQVEVRTDLTSPGDSGLFFGTHNLGGSLYMMFYF